MESGTATRAGDGRAHLAAASVLSLAYALHASWPRRDSLIGWGSDPHFSLWTFEIVWHRIAEDGPLWFLHRAAWRAPLFGGDALGLAYSENEAWPALFFWPLRQLSQNGAWAMQAGAVLESLAAFGCATAWLRRVDIGRLAPWGGLLFAASGWLQSQSGHFQNLCVFVIPLALWAIEAFRARPGFLRAALAGAAVGWMPGWNIYYLLFSSAVAGWLLLRGVRRGEIRAGHLAAFAATAAVLVAPFAIRYVEVSRLLGSFRAATSYGTAFTDILSRLHAPPLIPPRIEAAGEPGGLGIAWIALCAAALRVPRARPWLLAAAVACWIALGSNLGAWQILSVLPVVNGMQAIGRAQLLVVLFSIPAILLCLESLPRGWSAALLLLLVSELVPAASPERVRVDPAWFHPSRLTATLAGGQSVLVLPGVDPELMVALSDGEPSYFGGLSGRHPPGEESLAGSIAAGASVADLAAATEARRILARTPGFARAVAAIPGASLEGKFEHGSLYALPPAAPPLLIDRDAVAEERDTPWPTLHLRAARDGTFSVRRLDTCHLRQDLLFGPVSIPREVRLPGSEIRTLTGHAGDVIIEHVSKQAVFRLPPPLRPRSKIRIVCGRQ